MSMYASVFRPCVILYFSNLCMSCQSSNTSCCDLTMTCDLTVTCDLTANALCYHDRLHLSVVS